MTVSVNECVWNWRAPRASGRPEDTPAARRRRATVQTLIMLVVASLLFFRWDKRPLGSFVYAMAGLTFLGGFFIPPLFRALERFGHALARGVSAGLTWLLLVPFFYLFFVPARAILKLQGKDPMHRLWETGRPSYWIDRPPIPGAHHFTRQF